MEPTQHEPAGPDFGPLAFHAFVATATILLVAIDVLPVLFTGDVNRYHTIATGPMFWRDQPVEFPPLSAAMVWFVGRWGSASIKVLFVTNLVLDAATVLVVAWSWGRTAVNRYLVLVGLVLPLSLFRLDHLTVLLAVVGLALARRRREALGGAMLGLGVLGKLWPAALVAVRPRQDWRFVISAVTVTVLGTIIWVGLFGANAVSQVLSYRGATGWHVESVVGSLVRLLEPGEPAMIAGAWRVGESSMTATVALFVLGVVVLRRCWRLGALPERNLGVVTGLLVVSPLLSPQYMLWVCALAALMPPKPHRRCVLPLVATAAILTMVSSAMYADVLLGTPLGVATMAGRNLCLVVLAALLLRGRDEAGQPGMRPA